MCVLVWDFFFFKQKTAYEMRISDWSSDVCSSDLTLSTTVVYWLCLQLFKLGAQCVLERGAIGQTGKGVDHRPTQQRTLRQPALVGTHRQQQRRNRQKAEKHKHDHDVQQSRRLHHSADAGREHGDRKSTRLNSSH